jgi:uncharacterized protein (TIGR02246 family)
VFSGCTNQCPELTEQRKSRIEKQILTEWEKIGTAIENSDSEAYAIFISPDLILMSSGGSVFYSKTGYIDSVRSWFSTRKNTEIQQEKVTVTLIEEDIVLLDQESVFQVNYKDGNTQRVHHAVSLVFKKEPLAWMIIHGHESFSDIE